MARIMLFLVVISMAALSAVHGAPVFKYTESTRTDINAISTEASSYTTRVKNLPLPDCSKTFRQSPQFPDGGRSGSNCPRQDFGVGFSWLLWNIPNHSSSITLLGSQNTDLPANGQVDLAGTASAYNGLLSALSSFLDITDESICRYGFNAKSYTYYLIFEVNQNTLSLVKDIAKTLKQNYPTPSGFEVESMQGTYQSMLDRFEQTRNLMQNAGDLLALGRDVRCVELGITPPTTM